MEDFKCSYERIKHLIFSYSWKNNYVGISASVCKETTNIRWLIACWIQLSRFGHLKVFWSSFAWHHLRWGVGFSARLILTCLHCATDRDNKPASMTERQPLFATQCGHVSTNRVAAPRTGLHASHLFLQSSVLCRNWPFHSQRLYQALLLHLVPIW